jgi:hypothetical protein
LTRAEHRSPAGRCNPALRASLIALLALEIGSGCALFRSEEPVPPAFQRIAIRTQVDVTDDGELEGDLHGDTAVKGSVLGLGAGSVTGGGIGLAWGLLG